MGKLRFRHILHDGDPASIRAIAAQSGGFTDAQVELIGSAAITTLEGSFTYRWVLAEDEGQVIGFACYDRAEDSTSTFELYWIAVLPAHARQGLGRELVGQVARLARSKRALQLLADTSSRPNRQAARAFYTALGFTEIARLPDYHQKGDDRVVYLLRLNPDSGATEGG